MCNTLYTYFRNANTDCSITREEANERLLASVQRHVTAQVLAADERLAARLTHEVALIGVRFDVTRHVTGRGEARVTERVRAFVGLLFGVHSAQNSITRTRDVTCRSSRRTQPVHVHPLNYRYAIKLLNLAE